MPAVQDGTKYSIMIFDIAFPKEMTFFMIVCSPFWFRSPKFDILVAFIFTSYDKISMKTKDLLCRNKDFRVLFAILIPNVFLFTGAKPLVLWLAHGAR